jgi:hypothetical protein
MIGLKTLKENDIGKFVSYNPGHKEPETGKIKSWNIKWIFVVYNCNDDWDNFNDYTAAATRPEDLSFK